MCTGDCKTCLHDDPMACKPREECGVFGIITGADDGILPAYETYTALYALQHRGQESCGIAVNDRGIITLHKGLGLVNEVFNDKILKGLPGSAALGHVRYSTTGDNNLVNTQPISISHIKGNLALAHNGNLVNARMLREEIELGGGVFQTTNDSEIIAYLIVRERIRSESIEQAVLGAMKHLQGAYSMVVMSPRKLIAARDPSGFRPLCIGRLGNSYVFASETCALDSIGAGYVRDVRPGEMCVVEDGELRSFECGVPARHGMCVFEFVYFARPDSVIDGLPVETARQEMGRHLARAHPVEADVVIGVPDSGLSAALGYSRESGIPYGVGLIKNRYIGRTFIQPTQGQREKSVRIKLNALSAAVAGKRVIMVDDSIVRGTTSARIVSILREAGATEVHMRVSSPPYLHPCYFGTDVASTDVLIAHNNTVENIRRIIGVDSLGYLPVSALQDMSRQYGAQYCLGCFTGDYPIEVPELMEKNRFERRIGQ